MKIVFNTRQPDAAASLFYQEALQDMEEVSCYDQNFSAYDIALFMTYDYGVVRQVKEAHPSIKIGIIDPRSTPVLSATPYCDFLVVDGVEMEDFWRIAEKPIFKYAEYPRFLINQKSKTEKQNKDKTYIGYHGNPLHIMEGAKTLTPALTELGEKYDIELLLMVNTHAIGSELEDRYLGSLPSNVKITHAPWHMDNYNNFLARSDIGIVPNNLGCTPVRTLAIGDPKTDYCLSFKMTSNPGRIIVFGLMGIPVIADFYPSALQYLQNETGFVAHSKAGWKYCLEQLIKNKKLRETMGQKLKTLVEDKFNFDHQNKQFRIFLASLLEQ